MSCDTLVCFNLHFVYQARIGFRTMQSLLRAFYWMLIVVQCITGIGLIYIITIQESKNDGLSGQIGSTTATSSFKGKAGKEDQLNLITKIMSIAFFIVSAVVAYGTGRWDLH